MLEPYGPRRFVEVHPVLLDSLGAAAAFDSLSALRENGFLFARKAPALAAALAAEREGKVAREPARQMAPSFLMDVEWETEAGGGLLRWLGREETWMRVCRGWQWAVHQSATRTAVLLSACSLLALRVWSPRWCRSGRGRAADAGPRPWPRPRPAGHRHAGWLPVST